MSQVSQRDVNGIIHKQISFLDKLRKTQPQNVLPYISMFDLNSVLNKVVRERKRNQDSLKWKMFEKTRSQKSHKPSDGRYETKGLLPISKYDLNKNISQRNTSNQRSDTSLYLKSGFLENEDNVFLDMLKYQKQAKESNKTQANIKDSHYLTEDQIKYRHITKTVAKSFDFNSLLLQVQRKRKRQKDENKWKLFLQKKSGQEFSQGEENDKTFFPSSPISNLNCQINTMVNSNEQYTGEREFLKSDVSTFNTPDHDDTFRSELENACHNKSDPEGINKLSINEDELEDEYAVIKNQNNNYLNLKPKTDTRKGRENTTDQDNIQDSIAFQGELKKLDQVLSKITMALSNIKNLISKNKICSFHDDDFKRIKQRTMQFGMRFKGNYYYRTNHQLKELENFLSNSENINVESNLPLALKLTSAYQCILQALQVLEKQLRMNMALELIKELLCQFFLCGYDLYSVSKPYNEKIETQNIGNLFLETIDEIDTSKVIEKVLISKGQTKENKPEKKMNTPPPWIKKSAVLARTKFGPPVRLRNQKSIQNLRRESSEPEEKLHDCSKSEMSVHMDSTMDDGVKSGDSHSCSSRKSSNEKNENCTIEEVQMTEEPLSKVIAKRIQEVPGVDEELRKVEDARIKMMSLLLKIKDDIVQNKNTPLDKEVERIKLRTLEFGARFKRNYFYRMKCQVQELRSMNPNPFTIKKKSHILLVIQKLTAAHLSGLQALQVIEKQLQKITVIGLTQDMLCSYFHFIYELTFMLKPFYGYIKNQTLDDVEKLIGEIINIFKEMKQTDVQILDRNKRKSASIQKTYKERTIISRKPKGKYVTKNINPCNSKIPKEKEKGIVEDLKPIQNHSLQDSKGVQFMMSVKQRPGAEVRRLNFKNKEVKTMVEILAENELRGCCPEKTDSNDTIKSKTSLKVDENTTSIPMNEGDGKIIENNTSPNVKLVIIKRSGSQENEVEIGNQESPLEGSSALLTNIIEYRNEFKKFKKSISVYKKSIQPVKRMADRLMDEALHSAFHNIIGKIETCDSLKITLNDLIEN